MYEIDKTKARKILIEELQYDAFDANHLLNDFPPLSEILAQAVRKWLDDREIMNVEVQGITVQQVMKANGYNFLVAVKALNRLLDPSKTAEQCAKMRDSLIRPARYK